MSLPRGHELVRKKPFTKNRRTCPNCGHQFVWLDNHAIRRRAAKADGKCTTCCLRMASPGLSTCAKCRRIAKAQGMKRRAAEREAKQHRAEAARTS